MAARLKIKEPLPVNDSSRMSPFANFLLPIQQPLHFELGDCSYYRPAYQSTGFGRLTCGAEGMLEHHFSLGRQKLKMRP